MGLTERLAKSELPRGLPGSCLELIASFSRTKIFGADEVPYREGETANSVFVIVSGQVGLWMRVSRPSRYLDEHIPLITLGPHKCLGIGTLAGLPRHLFSAKTVSPTECVVTDRNRLKLEMAVDREMSGFISQNLVRILSGRLCRALEVLAYERTTRLV